MSPLPPLIGGTHSSLHAWIQKGPTRLTATNVIPSTHVDGLQMSPMSPRAILVFRPHVSSSGETYYVRKAGGSS